MTPGNAEAVYANTPAPSVARFIIWEAARLPQARYASRHDSRFAAHDTFHDSPPLRDSIAGTTPLLPQLFVCETAYLVTEPAGVSHTRRWSPAGFEVKTETISWGYPPTVFRGYGVQESTTDRLLMIDAEVGTILRAAARLEGREFYVAEVLEVSFDEKLAEGTFRLEVVPGVQFRREER
jgi:hypothetical protein